MLGAVILCCCGELSRAAGAPCTVETHPTKAPRARRSSTPTVDVREARVLRCSDQERGWLPEAAVEAGGFRREAAARKLGMQVAASGRFLQAPDSNTLSQSLASMACRVTSSVTMRQYKCTTYRPMWHVLFAFCLATPRPAPSARPPARLALTVVRLGMRSRARTQSPLAMIPEIAALCMRRRPRRRCTHTQRGPPGRAAAPHWQFCHLHQS